MRFTLKTAALLSSCLGVLAGPACAATSGAPVAETAAGSPADPAAPAASGDIVVTATRRAESLNKVPISVTALSQKTLETKGIRNISDLVTSIPGITLTQGWGASTNIAIRGIYSGTGAGTTGIYIDDTPIQSRHLGASSTFTNAYPALFDLERVEVLKGPQGSLFGAGSEGGTIRFISPAPSLTTYSGYSRAELAFTDGGAPSYEVGSAIGGPIIRDTLGFRLSGYFRKDGGYIDRDPYPSGTQDKNSNYMVTGSIHGALTYKTGNFTLTPSVYWQSQYRADSNAFWANLSSPSSSNYVSGQQLRQPETDSYAIYGAKAEYDFGFATLISNTSFLNRRDHSVADYSNFLPELLGLDYRAGVDIGFQSPAYMVNTQHSFTQEVRLQSNGGPASRLHWTVGVFYQNSRQTAEETVVSPGFDAVTQAYFGTDVAGVLGSDQLAGGLSYHGYATSRDRQIAAFGQVDYKIFPSLTATIGGRVARTLFNSTEVADGPLNGGPSQSSANAAQTPFTPKFGLSWQADRDWMLYFSASKGFREGGGNNKVAATALCTAGLAALGLSAAPTSYKSDTVWSYEVGAKGEGFNHHLNVAASGFWINWDGIQNGVSLDCGQGFTANLGNARSRGLEAQATITPLTGLSLSAALTYTDAKYTTSISSNGTTYIIRAGQNLPVAPWAVQLSGDYEMGEVHDGMRPYIHADYDYSSAYTFSLSNVSGYDPYYNRSYAQHIVNARAGVRRGKADLSVFVQNLTNSSALTNIHHDLTSSALFRNSVYRPRTVGLTLSYRY